MQQQTHNGSATMALPPEHPIVLFPCDMYTVGEMELVRDWVKASLRCRGPEEFEKATKGWSDASKAEIARILGELRAKGFYPDRIGEDGRVVWGVRLKSAVRLYHDRHADYWQKRGLEIDGQMGGSLARIMGKLGRQRSMAEVRP